MKIRKMMLLGALLALSATGWAAGPESSAPQAAMPGMMAGMAGMQSMHDMPGAPDMQAMQAQLQKIVQAKTQAQRQKLAQKMMQSMTQRCRQHRAHGMPMMAPPDASGHALHHPASAAQ